MKSYFENFPIINYTVGDITANVIDLSVRFKIVEDVLSRPNSYYDYYWKDEDRVDIVADRYYGDVEMAWLVLMSAQAFDWLYDLPLTEPLFDAYLQEKYKVDDVNDLRFITHAYVDVSGTIVDKFTYDRLTGPYRDIINIYDYEYRINERKRNIKLVSKAYIKDILQEFDKKLQEIKNNRRLFSM